MSGSNAPGAGGDPKLADDDYLAVQTQLFALAAIVREMPLAAFVDRIERADTIAPIVDPTLWIKGRDRLAIVKRVAEAAQRFQAALPSRAELVALGMLSP